MRASDLREMGSEELGRKLAELRDELFKLRLRRGGEELPNPLRIRMLRRDIARCMTVMREKQAAEVGERADG
ncbi:MAG: 50S ribosomal protein L29 [candidate division WOR-3 bacterium]|nr:MAG: 50S ribosomal protein L29 [candidate division WOR-3 bacterium]